MCRGETDDVTDPDPDLAKAMAASLQDVSGPSQYGSQEVGITGTHSSPNPNFMPATENKEYNPSEWALTTTVTRDIVSQEPPPQERKRQPGVPAFLKPSPPSYNLPGALTILHSIPHAREALLARKFTLPYYGEDPKWWCGEKIQTSLVISAEREAQIEGYADACEELAEIQRLMAFLDHTDRAYGSIEVLSSLPRAQEQELTCMFFHRWHYLTLC